MTFSSARPTAGHTSPRRRPSGTLLAVLVCAISVLVAACGSSASSSAGQAAGARRSNPNATSKGQSSKPVDEASAAKLQKVLDDARAEGGFPGVIAGVWTPDGSWVGASGSKGRDEADPPSATDRTRIGSVTKTMTATVLLQLVEEGKVSLDDTVGRYVPDIANGDRATLRQVANMTSGIPDYTSEKSFFERAVAEPKHRWTPNELLDLVRGKGPNFAPGERFEYSNTNYVLLGLVVEQVTGKPFGENLRERIFAPLGMTDSAFPSDGNFGGPHLDGVAGHQRPDGKVTDATDWNPSIGFAGGQVTSTLDDLKKWADALFTGDGVLKPETQQLRRESIDQGSYGLGIAEKDGWWGHTGEIFGYTTILLHNYEHNTTVIVIVNSDIPAQGSDTDPASAVFNKIVSTGDGG